MFTGHHTYTKVPIDDRTDDFEAQKAKQKRRDAIRNGGLLLALFLAVLLALSLVANYAQMSQLSGDSTNSTWSSCGNDSATARSRGCSFDLISFAWQTPECYDDELVSEFVFWKGNWSFYSNVNLTEPVDQFVAMQGETQLYVPWEYHIVHCTFMWRQMHRAYERGWIDAHLGNYNHTLHCQQMILMNPEEAKTKTTGARLIYPECIKVHGKQSEKIGAIRTPEYEPA
ncbi:hypothetical protein PRZ48_006897 [Zasmidium cellare]|uniref:Uncharacterized protein n=1 Tax=Zasmidium cellare TaxID=395010 RepID=A0ABR0EHV3_ZASCE|nr:hypothetical protein PRZ48_006897 [Zasmidium cellare]